MSLSEPDRLPPYDLAAEESVIASCMVDDAAAAEVGTIVGAEDFFQEKYGFTYGAIQALAGRGEPTSPIAVAHELSLRGQLDAVGGVAALMGLTTELPTAVSVAHFARLVAAAAVYRRLVRSGGSIAQIGYDGTLGPTEALARSYDLVREAEGPRVDRDWVSVAELTTRFLPAFLDRIDHPERARGVPTGLRGLDHLLAGRGLLPGKLYVAGGYTSMGKSTFLRIVLRNMALAGTHVALVSPEQTEDEVWEELLFGLAGFDHGYHEATGAPLTEADERGLMVAAGRLGELGTFHLSDVVAPSPAEIRLRLLRLKAQHPDLAVVGIDYLHILRNDRQRRAATEENDLTDMTKAIRDMAKELGLACILMAQLNRASQSSQRADTEFRPVVTDFHGASTIEKVAYAVLALHRRGYYVAQGRLQPDPSRDHTLDVLVLKQQRGALGTARLRFSGALSQIADLPEWE